MARTDPPDRDDMPDRPVYPPIRPTAAVPVPRFRDQLARAYTEWVCSPFDPTHWQTENGYDLADRIEKLVAAEVEARVQAAANQGAAEAVVKRVAALAEKWGAGDFVSHGYGRDLRRALDASQTGGGQ